MTVSQALNAAIKKLKNAGDSPALDAEVLLAHVLRRDRSYLYANPQKKLTRQHAEQFARMVHKRARRWPMAYLTGHKEFLGLDFRVSRDVLIPRPETELLVDLALKYLQANSYKLQAVVDLGTGSGNIIISLAKSISGNLKFYALDSSAKALKIARLNARRHGVAKKIKFLHGNLLDPLLHLPLMRGRVSRGHSNLIIANLPYLTPSQYSANPDLQHEPRPALVGGKDGLKYFKELFKQLYSLFANRYSLVLLEFDPRQKRVLQSLARKFFPSPTKISKRNLGGQAKIRFHKDLSGRDRVMEVVP